MTLSRTRAFAGVVLAFALAADALAQSRLSDFAGQWQGALAVDPRASTIVLDVATNGLALAVTERSPDRGWRRPTAFYSPDSPQGSNTSGSSYLWLASDRLELHDLLVNARGGRTAVTAQWTLLDAGRTLRIQRTLRAVDDVTTPAETHVYTYRR